jgi:DNA-binding Lrp family transcriptional regulator
MFDMDSDRGEIETLLTESDLALVEALQPDVRAPWAVVGAALGVSAATARRRWERLVERGGAWFTSYPRPGEADAWGFVEVRCRPGTVDDVAAALVREPTVLTISGVTGDRDLVLLVGAESMRELRVVLQQRIGTLDDVVSARTALMTKLYVEGSSWRPGVPRIDRPVRQRRGPVRLGGREQRDAVLAVLERDGRAGSAELAAALGVGESHARRITGELVATRRIVQRVDVSLDQRIWPHALVLWMVAPAASVDAVARRIGELPLTRLCAAIAGGASNLYVIVWLRSLAEAPKVEAEIVGDGGVRVLDRSLMLHYYKRLGHVFDAHGKRTGFVSWAQHGTVAE